MQNALSPGPWCWEFHGNAVTLCDATGRKILRASGVCEYDAAVLQSVPKLIAALRQSTLAMRDALSPLSADEIAECWQYQQLKAALESTRAALTKARQATR